MSDFSDIVRPNNQDPTTIGRPYEYTVIITARDLTTYGTTVRWSQLSWTRVLDEISEATVVVPDRFFGPNCLIELGGSLVPWRFGIRIERNGELVWAGPIVNISRPVRDGVGQDFITITAQDKMTWMRKRLFPNFRSYTNIDAGEIFRQAIVDGTAADNFFKLFCPEFETKLTMTREIVPLDLEFVSSVVDDLAGAAVDWFVVGNDLAVYDRDDPAGWYVFRDGQKERLAPTPDDEGRYIYGVFTDNAWIERPGYELDGESQANSIFVAGTESGPDGFGALWLASDVNPLDGLLAYVDVNPLYRPQVAVPIEADGVFQERAQSLLELRKSTPVIISGGSLAWGAPVSVDGLFPGSLWVVDLADKNISQMVTVQRLKRVDVSVVATGEGIVEMINPTLMPLGTE